MKKSKFKIETACGHDSETADVSFQKNRGNFNVYSYTLKMIIF